MKVREKLKFLAIIMCCFVMGYSSLLAKAPELIRVGLESVYKDQSEIKLSSKGNMKIGFWDNGRLREEGKLDAPNITIRPVNSSYYTLGDYYDSFQEANNALGLYGQGAVIAYTEEGDYGIYMTQLEEGVMPVFTGSSAYEVYNDFNELILVCDNTTRPLVFQGEDYQYSYPITGVGATRQYRGAIEIVKGQYKGLTPVSLVGMEEYLYSVVGGEMVASWHEEALKAQAVTARGIATFQYKRHLAKGYNVTDSTVTQVYKGISAEHPRTIAAVEATRGEIATYNGNVAETLYYSTSGGYTEDPVYVWGNTVPYLKAVPDTYEVEPEMKPWSRKITLAEVEQCVKAKGGNVGTVTGVELVSRTPSGRVNEMNILGTMGTYTVKNEDVRTFFSSSKEGSLRSRMFQFIPYGQENTGGGSSQQNVSVITSSGMATADLALMKVTDGVVTTTLPSLVFASGATNNTILEKDAKGQSVQTDKSAVYSDFTVYGKGFGHGVGMSQSGAKGMANAGFTYDEIIKYYYPGVIIE
ncbi:MAG: SpoIID/LytB domain-containing protein [Cellulosilyticaceae bacterium]